MKKISLLAFLLSFIMIGFTSCSKSNSGPSATTRTLQTQASTPNVDMMVTFQASQTGDGTISTLTYTYGSTSKTVTNPPLPWSITVSVSAQDAVSMTATATATNGGASISYDGQGSGGSSSETITGQDSFTTSSSK
ncbi:MAG: hypothetical protein IH595_04625 [Bacteroidales bacterium]|nr:hypothetical protein [Bacteroidales bacterium]